MKSCDEKPAGFVRKAQRIYRHSTCIQEEQALGQLAHLDIENHKMAKKLFEAAGAVNILGQNALLTCSWIVLATELKTSFSAFSLGCEGVSVWVALHALVKLLTVMPQI